MSLPDRPIEVRRHAHPKARGVAKDLGAGAAGAFPEEHELPARVPGPGISRQTGPRTYHWRRRSRLYGSRTFLCAILSSPLAPTRVSISQGVGLVVVCPLKCYRFPIVGAS